jgi:DNA-binding NarL/FixJ family response regulator
MLKSAQRIKVMIVDDHQLIIDGLYALFSEEEGVRIVAAANSGSEALEILRNDAVDVVLVDINMPGMSGIELTTKIRQKYPGLFVLALTMHAENSLINKMIEAGASGYVLKSTHISDLCAAIEAVASGKKYLSPDVQSIIMRNICNPQSALAQIQPKVACLSKRETEILNLIAQEFTNEEIADKLFIGKRTVETHRRNIFVKTKTKTIVGLIRYAIDNNLIESSVPVATQLNYQK